MSKCIRCTWVDTNEETYPFCITCAYCRKKKHILQVHLDGTLPIFCQECDYKKWKEEFDKKTSAILKQITKYKSKQVTIY